ncbi:MAG TPA: terpene cyclase/mutase family protein [Anaerolineae bacterium]|nr:terpene cyclase/mutase family protein [Anaerolineae bacterium]HQI85784.1 terpene cyclase/mutase family protein [Anaerolineae bacterium]HQK12408.1 terpene cyclase/mutase family protein [Anaerolineae bacterium]
MKKFGLMVLVLGLVLAWTAPVTAARRSQDEAALAWLRGFQQADGGFTNGFSAGSDIGATTEVILAAAAAGQDCSTWLSTAGNSPLDYLVAQVQQGTVKDAAGLSRAVLAAVATGQDPRNFGGKDLVQALLAAQDKATGRFGDSLYAHAYAMLALHNAGAPVPQSAVTLLKTQIADDGAWSLFGGPTAGLADTNTTALAMQALLAVGERDAASGALPYLQRMQNTDGGFPYQKPSAWGTDTDANSTAVVLQALYALGEPLGNWAGSGTDPLGALLALWDAASGGYYWQAAVPFANIMATAQAVQAVEGMHLVNVAVVGAARTPQVKTTTAPVTASDVPLLPMSGGFAPGYALIFAGLLMMGAGLTLRKR